MEAAAQVEVAGMAPVALDRTSIRSAFSSIRSHHILHALKNFVGKKIANPAPPRASCSSSADEEPFSQAFSAFQHVLGSRNLQLPLSTIPQWDSWGKGPAGDVQETSAVLAQPPHASAGWER